MTGWRKRQTGEHMTKDEALVLAMETLESIQAVYPCETVGKRITAINKSLAQPEQTNTRPYHTIDEINAWADEKEKQAWRNAAIRIGEELSSVGPDGYYEMDAWKWLDWAMEQEPRGKNSLAQPAPVQEPVQDSTCNETLRAQGKAYPRTCRKCGLGPCIGAPKQPPAQPAPVQEPVTQEPFGYFQYDIRLDAWVQNRINNKGVAFYTKEKT